MNGRRCFFLICLILQLSLFAVPVSAAEHSIAVINYLAAPYDLNPYVEFIEDPERSITYEALQTGTYESQWQQNKNAVFMGKNPKTRYWFRLTLQFNQDLSTLKPIMYSPYQAGLLSEINLWLPNEKGEMREVSTGNFHAYGQRNISSLQYAFQLPASATAITLVGWVDQRYTSVPALLPLYLLSTDQFNQASNQVYGILIAFYSILSALLLYNGCLYATLKQPVYGYYLLFLSAATFTCLFLDGSSMKWLWPSYPELNLRISLVNGVGSVILYLAFVWEALDRLYFSRRLQKGFQLTFLIGALAVLHNSITPFYFYAALVTQLFSILLIVLTGTAIVFAVRHRIPTAGYLLVAETCALAGAVKFMLVIHGIISLNEISVWSIHGGYLGEALLLSLALAARTRVAQRDKIIAEAKNEAKSQFFASMSHELRTPLTAILGYAETAKANNLSLEEKNQHIATIERSGLHLLQLVNDILDLSKIEAQKLEVERIEVNLMQMLQEVKEYFSILAMKKHITFAINYRLPIPESICTDPTRLKQTLINLCGNAVKFTEHGSVTLQVACDKAQQKIQFAIQDTGIGLKPDQVTKLFAVFSQADNTTTRNFGGTGLGLHLSKQIAEKLGGDISVESEFGRGSTFTLTVDAGPLLNVTWLDSLPLSNVEIAPADNPSLSSASIYSVTGSHQNSEHKPLRVLLAEDNLDNQTLIALLVNRTGAQVQTVNDGVEAIVEGLKGDFDLILMDMQMPLMGGLEAVQLLRAKGFNKPIYALTANDAEKTIQQCLDAGCNDHLSKPVDTVKLAALITLLSNTRSTTQL